ncbi:hypothetical protein ACWGLF_35660 [Streptomyces puniciscabiei]
MRGGELPGHHRAARDDFAVSLQSMPAPGIAAVGPGIRVDRCGRTARKS